MSVSKSADFCVGYFNLRGWRKIDQHIEGWSGQDGNSCRLLVGMHKSPEKGLREKLATAFHDDGIDNARALELKKELAEEFRAQLALGSPSNDDEAGLRRLARQIRGGKVTVKLFLKHQLHAKLYLLSKSAFRYLRVRARRCKRLREKRYQAACLAASISPTPVSVNAPRCTPSSCRRIS